MLHPAIKEQTRLTIRVGDASLKETVAPGSFELIMDAGVDAGKQTLVELSSDQSVRPGDLEGSDDQRSLVLRLTRIQFEPDRSKTRVPGSLPIYGPVFQKGKTEGYWPDHWVSSPLRFSVVANEAVRRVHVSGLMPQAKKEERSIVLSVGDQSCRQTVREDSFGLALEVDIGQGEERAVEISSDKSFVPSQEGPSEDHRSLSFPLKRILFES